MAHRLRNSWLLPAATALLGCSAEAGNVDLAAASAREEARDETAAQEPKQLELTIASLPYAECSLRSAQEPDAFSVSADDEGIVHLWAVPRASSDPYSLDCNEDGRLAHYRFDLADPASFRGATPRVAPIGRSVRPPLADPEGATQEQLNRGGYPPRPDPSSPLYVNWLAEVSIPVTVIGPHERVRPELLAQPRGQHDPTSLDFDPVTSNLDFEHAGLLENGSGARYSLVIGSTVVPSFTSTGSGANAAMWIGLDGWGTTELLQDGVFFGPFNNVISYKAFYQFRNADLIPWGLTLPQFPRDVGPGDNITFYAWEGDSSCNFGYPNDIGYGCIYWYNATRNEAFGTLTIADPGGYGALTCKTCEAVMERQKNSRLARWSSAQMTLDCYHYFGGHYDLTSQPYINSTMVTSAWKRMAEATKLSATSVGFRYLASQ